MKVNRRKPALRFEDLELRRCMSISPVSSHLTAGTGGADVLTTSFIMGPSEPGIDHDVADSFQQQTTGVLNLNIPPYLPPELDEAALPTDPTHRVSGQVTLRYWNRVIDDEASPNRDDYPFRFDVKQELEDMPVRFAKVVLQDPDGHYIKGELNGNGEFEFEWIPLETGFATITVWSVFDAGNRDAAVGDWIGGEIDDVADFTTDSGDYLVFSYTQLFSVAMAQIDNGGLDLNIVIDEDHESAPAFHFLDNALVALDYFYDINGVHTLPKLNIVYTPDIDNLEDGETGIYIPGKHPGFIYINPDFAWNGFALRHEASHMFQNHYLRNDSYGRIGEPLANVHAAAMVGNGLIDKQSELESLDVQANFKEGQFILQDSAGNYWEYHEGPWAIYDEDGEIVTTVNSEGEVVNVLPSSGWVQRVLWDLIDGSSSTVAEPVTTYLAADGMTVKDVGAFFDAIDGGGGPGQSDHGGNQTLNDVLVHYLGGGIHGETSDEYMDRGFDDVDIVDVLDGMVIRGHANALSLAWLMNEAMDFGYNFPLEYVGVFDMLLSEDPADPTPHWPLISRSLASNAAIVPPLDPQPVRLLASPVVTIVESKEPLEKPKRTMSKTEALDLAYTSLTEDDWLM